MENTKRSWKDKVTVSRQDLINVFHSYDAIRVIGEWSKECDDEEIAHRIFDIIKKYRSSK